MITYRHLLTYEYKKYGRFLKSLDSETLISFFGIPTKHEAIDKLVESITNSTHKHTFIIATDKQFNWVGVVHIALHNKSAELGVIVKPEFRNRGIGNELISQAILFCRNRGYLDIYMHCVSRNNAIMHLVQKHNLKISREYSEADATIKLPLPDIYSLFKEQLNNQYQAYKSSAKLLSYNWYDNQYFN